jgi:hypothetical protein
MSDGSATFVIDLDASSAGMSAEQAADRIEQLNAEMAKARDLSKAWKAAGADGKAGLEEQKRKVESLRAAIQSHNLAMAKQGVTLREVRDKRKADADATAKSTAAFLAAGKRQIETVAAVKKWNDEQRKTATAAASASAAGLKAMASGSLAAASAIAAAAAATGLVAGLGALIIKSADARRSELLRLEGMTKMRSWWGVAAGNATELQGAIDRVSASSAISREQVAGYAAQLYKAGVRGSNLSNTLDAMAIKASTQGEEAAQSFAGWATGAALAGQSVKGLADRVRGQLGGIARKQMLSLDVQWMKFKENIAGIGKAFNIEPVLRGLNTVLSMFREGAAVGDAWRTILKALFGPIFEDGEQGGLAIKRVIQGATIAILKMATVGVKASTTIGNMLPDWAKQRWIDWDNAVKATEVTLYILGGTLAVIAAGITLTVGGVLVLAGAMVAAWIAAKKMASVASEMWDAFKTVPWSNLGSAIVDGIVGGIKSAATGAVDAIGGLAASMRDKFKNVMGIHSPSTVFKAFGRNLPDSTAKGVEEGSPRAQQSVVDMVKPPGAGSYSATNTTNSSRSVVIQTMNVTAGSQGMAASIRDEVTQALESIALEMGGARV